MVEIDLIFDLTFCILGGCHLTVLSTNLERLEEGRREGGREGGREGKGTENKLS